jgi:KaiC/GvpD/RAD55 family RecA-like ATPase
MSTTQQTAPEVSRIEIPVTSSLPMKDMVQSAFLGHLILNEKLFLQVSRRVKPSWFANLWHGKIYKALLDFTVRVGRPPNKIELEQSRELELEGDLKSKNTMLALIGKAGSDSGQIRWDAIKPELTEWLQSKILQETLLKSAKHWNKGQWQDTARLMQAAVAEFRDAQFEEGSEISFSDPELWLARQKEEKQEALPTGLKLLDEALLGGATSGGLQRGDTTVILAPSNTGKTTCILSIVVHNIQANKDVLLMTHEGRPEDIRMKVMKAALDCTEEEMLNMYHTPEGLQKLRTTSALISSRLIYIPYNKAGMKVEDVVPIIRRAQEERKSKTGKGFDLLAVDYPAKLTTEQAKGSLAMRNVIEIVYDYYVQLALEYGFHSLLAIQTNREGSKVNNGQNTTRLLTMEDVQEAWGPMTSASNVITLNRSPQAKKKNRITLYVAKSRSSETGQAIVARSNFAHGLTHSPTLGGAGYFGTCTMEATIDNYMVTFNNAMIPQNFIR